MMLTCKIYSNQCEPSKGVNVARCLKLGHLAICEHWNCQPSATRPFGRAFITKQGCTMHSYTEGWNLNSDPSYRGPQDYVRPAIRPAINNDRPDIDEGTKKGKVGKGKNQKSKR